MKELHYLGLPWKDGGRTLAGVDCVGLAWLWQVNERKLDAACPASDKSVRCDEFLLPFAEQDLERGDVVFFRSRQSGRIEHVATHVGGGRLLHILRGLESRIENGPVLLRRIGLEPAGYVPAGDVQRLCNALADPALGGWDQLIMLIVAVVLAAIGWAMMPDMPKNSVGRYGQNALLTQKNPEIPLPDVLGRVVLAGNAVYQQLADTKFDDVTAADQMWCFVLVLSSSPVQAVEWTETLQIKGTTWSDKSFHNETEITGLYPNPAQTKAEAISGTILGGTRVPSFSVYEGEHAIAVPVDVRAQYDRGFPIYGLSGCAYIVFRLADATKFAQLNVTCRVQGRNCRTFDANGFVATTVSGESLTGADGTKVRFKLANADIAAVSSLTVNGTSYSEISASAQTGNVYQLNKTKGFVEFITAPAAAATVTISYTCYARTWSQNPALQIVYLLTEKLRGRGFDASRIDWASMVAARDYYDEAVSWNDGSGVATAARFKTDYALDYRKPAQEHLQALLDGCSSVLFMSGGKFVLRPLSSGASVFTFDTSNIAVGEDGESLFEAELVDRSGRSNRIKAAYHSAETLNAETEAIVDDEDDQRARVDRLGNGGIVEQQLKLLAVTSASQAQRLAESLVAQQVGSRWSLRWTTTVKGLAIQPADLVDVTHPALSSTLLVRVWSVDHDESDRLVLTGVAYVPGAAI